MISASFAIICFKFVGGCSRGSSGPGLLAISLSGHGECEYNEYM